MTKKNKYIEPRWYKLGYHNYNYFLDRKYICYSGKRIMFSWNLFHFQDVLFILNSCGYENK